MDVDKSLYMADFLKLRDELGTVELYPTRNTLFTNLYDEFRPKEQINEVKEIIKEIEEKSIHLAKQDNQHILFPDLPDLLDETKEVEPIEEDIKVIKVSENLGALISYHDDLPDLKEIKLDPHYIPSD